MRLFQIIIFFFIFNTPNVFSQYSKREIKKIRKEYRKIQNELKLCNKKTLKIQGNSAEGGSTTAYIKNGQILIVRATWLGETGKRIVENYYRNELPFFVFEQKYKYNQPIYYDKEMAKENNDPEHFNQSKSLITKNRYYFKNGRIIRWIGNNNKDKDLKKADTETLTDHIIEESHMLRTLFE